jgi:hypothetical protein
MMSWILNLAPRAKIPEEQDPLLHEFQSSMAVRTSIVTI